MVKKDDIIKDFLDVVQGVTTNDDECVVLYFDKSTTELRHFGTSRGQQFLSKHEEFIHRFMAFCSGTKDLEACLNVTDAASIVPNTGNVQNVSKKERNPEKTCSSVTDKGQSLRQNTVNTSQNESNLNPSRTNLILAGHYRKTGDIQTVMCGKQTGFSPEQKQLDHIVIKDDPDSVQKDPDSVLNEPDSVLNDPDPVQNYQDPVQNYLDPIQIDPNPVQIHSALDPVKSEIHSIKNDQDSVKSNLPVAPKKVEQDDVKSKPNPVHNNVGFIENNRESVQNKPIPVQRDPDPVQNKADPLLWDQIYQPSGQNSEQRKKFVVLRQKSNPFYTVIPVLNPNSAPLLKSMLNPRAVPNLTPDSAVVPNLKPNSAVVPNLTPNSAVVPKLTPNSAVLPNLTPNSSTGSNLRLKLASVLNLSSTLVDLLNHPPNSASLPNLTPKSASVPNFTPNTATVPNLTPKLATVPNFTPNTATVPNLIYSSATLPNQASNLVAKRHNSTVVPKYLTPNLATVPDLTPNSSVVPNLKPNSATVPNLTPRLVSLLNRPPCSTVVPNVSPKSANAPNLISNLANDLQRKPLDQKQGHMKELREHTSKADMVQCEEHLNQNQEHMSKAGEHIRPLYSTVDIDLECTEVKVENEDDMEQCEEHLDQGQEHNEHKEQGQEHMELSREQGQEQMELFREEGQEYMEHKEQDQEHIEHKEQGQEHMELSREQGHEHMELSREQDQEHMEHKEHKSGEHHGFKDYLYRYMISLEHPYARKLNTQSEEEFNFTNQSGERIHIVGTTGERINTEDCELSLLMEVNEVDETTDQNDGEKEKDQTQKITTGAGKPSSPVRNSEEDKPRKLTADMIKKERKEVKVFSLMMVSYEASYEMPDGATLTCLQCNQNFKDLKDLQFHLLISKHIQVSTTETAFKCFTCLRYFQREWDLQQHMINTRHNGNVKNAHTSLSETKKKLEKIVWKDGSTTYRCLKCGNKFSEFLDAKSHVMGDQCSRQYCIRCQVCDELFLDKNSHQVHLRTVHKEDFPFRCKNCFKIFYRKNFYARHMEHCIQGTEEIGRSRKAVDTFDSENLDAEQICIICRETFINYDQLKAHIVQSGHEQVSTTETINKCFTCNTYFQKYVDLTYHMSITSHTGNPRESRKRRREIFPSIEKCEEHVKEKTCTDRWSKQCPFCPKTFFQKNIYEVHIKSEHDYQRPLACDKCGQEYTQLSAFFKHQEVCNHGNDKLPFQQRVHEIKRENYCAICDQTFSSLIALKVHKWRTHKKTIFKCEICKCKFIRLSHLMLHLKMEKHLSSVSGKMKEPPGSSPTTETNVKNTTKLLNECNVIRKKSKDGKTLYTCGICSRAFGKYVNLTMHHRAKHFRPKSLLCEYCGYETWLVSNFKLHLKSVHNKDYDITVMCNICGEEMPQPMLKKHMTTHTETPEEVETHESAQTHVKTQDSAQTHVETQESAQTHVNTVQAAQLSGKDQRAGNSKEPVMFKCNFCINATFDTKRSYEMHMLRHYGEEGRLSCMLCDATVAGYSPGMLGHLRREHNLSYKEAIIIRGNVEPVSLRLAKLMKKYSEKGPPVPNLDHFQPELVVSKSDPNLYKVIFPVSSESFLKQTSLKTLSRNHVETVPNPNNSDIKLCNINREEVSKDAFRTNMVAHKGAKKASNIKVKKSSTYKCNFCTNATFYREHMYQLHMLEHYGDEGKVTCTMCGQMLRGHANGFYSHLKRFHNLSSGEALDVGRNANLEPLSVLLAKLQEKYAGKDPPVLNQDYFQPDPAVYKVVLPVDHESFIKQE